MNTSQKIIKYIQENGQVTGSELVDYLSITDRAVRKQLKYLLDNSRLVKTGKPPKVYYSIPPQTSTIKKSKDKFGFIDKITQKLIKDNFLYITPRGTMLEGLKGFAVWCQERNLDLIETASTYQETISKYQKYRKQGLIDGMYKMKSSFDNIALDELFYIDFYALEIFGKTKLGQLLLFAKQSQNRELINQLADIVNPTILKLIKKFNIDGVGFIPPTVKRELQLIKQLQKRLNLDTREVVISKVKTPVAVPQKTLSKIDDRIINARETIVVEGKNKYNNILLIDDAVGSGSTLNETAKKIRQRGQCQGEIIGLAITGSFFKGFEVISEV